MKVDSDAPLVVILQSLSENPYDKPVWIAVAILVTLGVLQGLWWIKRK